MATVIRPAQPTDGSVLREIERLAGERFRDVGLPEVADDEPPSWEALARYAQEGRSWVAVDRDDAPIGCVLVDLVDGCAHIAAKPRRVQQRLADAHRHANLAHVYSNVLVTTARERVQQSVTRKRRGGIVSHVLRPLTGGDGSRRSKRPSAALRSPPRHRVRRRSGRSGSARDGKSMAAVAAATGEPHRTVRQLAAALEFEEKCS